MASKTPLCDPPVRKDGKCSYCGGSKPEPNDPKGLYRVDLDPFCSTRCCKEYYHVTYDLVADAPISRDMSHNGKR